MGSHSNTASSAAASMPLAVANTRSHRAIATTASIQSVRWAGTANPASNAYAKAPTNPETAAALRAGTWPDNAGACRHRRNTSANASPATMVTCRPEMLIR